MVGKQRQGSRCSIQLDWCSIQLYWCLQGASCSLCSEEHRITEYNRNLTSSLEPKQWNQVLQKEAPQQLFQHTQTQSTAVCHLIKPGKASRLMRETSDCKTIPAFWCPTDLLPVSNPRSSLLVTLKSLPPGKFLR